MKVNRKRPHPERLFGVAVLLLSALALLSLSASSLRTNFFHGSEGSLHRRDVGLLRKEDECHLVHSAKDQCAFVKESCDDDDGMYRYLIFYYCTLSNVKPIAFILIVLWAGLLFTTIGVAASDFFCVNLSTIAHILGMSESMAGVTFLAFGNGSPDVFSTFSAIKSHSGSLAIGELIGAAGFITTVVSGSMALVRPFKVAKRSFVRDIGFFIIAVAFSMVFLANGKLNIWECAVMVAFYAFYVIFVVVWHWWLARARRRREAEAAARGHFVMPGQEELEFEEEYRDDDDDDPSTAPRPTVSRGISIQDLNDLERADITSADDLDDLEEVRDRWMGELSSNMRVTKPPDGERRSVFNPIRPSLVGALEFRAVLASLQKSRNIKNISMTTRRHSEAPYYRSASYDNHSTVSGPAAGQAIFQSTEPEYSDLDEPRRNLDVRGGIGNRIRAVSANDADGLQLNPNALSREVTASQRMLDVDPPRLVHSPDHLAAEDALLIGDKPPSPLVSISPPPPSEPRSPDHIDTETRQRTGTQDLLAPPSPELTIVQRHGRVSTSSQALNGQTPESAHDHHDPPQLEVPRPRRASPRISPSHSPFVPYRDDPNSTSRPPSLVLPPPSASPESIVPRFISDSHRPLKWWPYKVLPPPGVIFRTLFPTLYTWRDKSLVEKVLGICTVPSFLLLTLTLPVVEPEQEKHSLAPEWMGKTDEPSGAVQDFAAQPKRHHSHGGHESATIAVSVEASHGHSNFPDLTTPVEADATPIADEPASHATSHGDTWNRWLVFVHCFTSPFFVVLIVWSNTSGKPKDLLKPSLYSLLASLIVLIFLIAFTRPSHPPKGHFLLCFAGFVVSVCWISTVADAVVAILQAFGLIFQISEAILGLTIFAVGNSLGDLVADITVARLGFPVMALSACFGGPLLNILLGVGIAAGWMCLQRSLDHSENHPDAPWKWKSYHIELNTTLLISGISLLITLIGLLIVVPLNKWIMDRKIGFSLMALWAATVIVNVIIEVLGVGRKLTGGA